MRLFETRPFENRTIFDQSKIDIYEIEYYLIIGKSTFLQIRRYSHHPSNAAHIPDMNRYTPFFWNFFKHSYHTTATVYRLEHKGPFIGTKPIYERTCWIKVFDLKIKFLNWKTVAGLAQRKGCVHFWFTRDSQTNLILRSARIRIHCFDARDRLAKSGTKFVLNLKKKG